MFRRTIETNQLIRSNVCDRLLSKNTMVVALEWRGASGRSGPFGFKEIGFSPAWQWV